MKTLHVIDVENIFGGPFQGNYLFDNCRELYEQIMNISKDDYILIASNPELFNNLLNSWAYDPIEDKWIDEITSGDLFGKCSDITIKDTLTIFARPGKDGADKVLMEKAVDKLDDFDRIIVASGDHFFIDLCNKVLKLSKKLVIISTQHGFSNSLKRIPCEKITFEMKKNESPKTFGYKWKSKIGAAA